MAAASNRTVGMMDDAYFVGRKVILDWLNELLAMKLSKIEDTAPGHVACQVMDCLFPGMVPMSKVNWGARVDYEFVANYKVLQSVCDKLKVDRAIEVDRLIRARYQDNLEFMQWLKAFYDQNCGNVAEDYDPIARRNKGKNASQFKFSLDGAPPVKKKPTPAPVEAGEMKDVARVKPKEKENKPASNKSIPVEKVSELETQIDALQKENSDLKTQVEGLETERNFYFNKLRDVELILQNYRGPDKEVARSILKILYATEDDVDGEAALATADAVIAQAEAEDDEQEEQGEQGDGGQEAKFTEEC